MPWNWVTQEQFDEWLETEVAKLSTRELMSIPGMYEVLSEYLNNQVLESLAEYNDRCGDCGSKLDKGTCKTCEPTEEDEDEEDEDYDGDSIVASW